MGLWNAWPHSEAEEERVVAEVVGSSGEGKIVTQHKDFGYGFPLQFQKEFCEALALAVGP